MLPAVILLFCWWKKGAIFLADLKRIIPFLLVALILGCVIISMQMPTPISVPASAKIALGSGTDRRAGCLFLYGKFSFPHKSRPDLSALDPCRSTLLQIALWPVLLGLLALAYAQKPWGRHIILGLGFFLLMLLPAWASRTSPS